MEYIETEKNPESIVYSRLRMRGTEPAPKNVPENEHVECQHQQWVEHGPGEAEMAAAVSQFHVADRKLPQEGAVPPQIGHESEGIEDLSHGLNADLEDIVALDRYGESRLC